MKKIIIFLAAICACIAALAQKTEIPEAPYLPIDERTNLVTYQDVVKQEGTPQVLYDRAMAWAKKYYKNTAEVIKSADPEKGVINMRSSVRIFYKDKEGTHRLLQLQTRMPRQPLPLHHHRFQGEGHRFRAHRSLVQHFRLRLDPQHVRLPLPNRRGDAKAHRILGGGNATCGRGYR